MKLKIFLATGTALGLLASTGVAIAASNFALVNQIGGDNSADVLQDGAHNQTRILQGTLAAPGNNNIAIVNQDGTGNLAGFQAYADNQWTLRQYGNNNLIDIDQDGKNNEVGQDNGSRYGGPQATMSASAASASSRPAATMSSTSPRAMRRTPIPKTPSARFVRTAPSGRVQSPTS